MKKIQFLSILFFVCFCTYAQFEQKPLPYSYNALEPTIDTQTMEIHYSKHHAAYVKNLNIALKGLPNEKTPLLDILSSISTYSATVRNNAGGHYNHELFWSVLTPQKGLKPSKELEIAIIEAFGSLDAMKEKINAAATSRFGSGWAWLYVNNEGKLAICSTANQDNPLMDSAENKGKPIFCIDVWEHAYYLKYQNKRVDYLVAIWDIVNWNTVSFNYQTARILR
jgi:superoxide dismutase